MPFYALPGFCSAADEGFGDGNAMDLDLPAY